MTERSRPAVILRYDLRAPSFGPTSAELVAAALEQATFADAHGFERVQISEHHHTEDGYCPSPFVVAAAFAARTSQLRIRLSALILTLHDPVRAAEDLAMLDIVSNGRAEAVVAAGYREIEFRMLGRDYADRGTRLREAITALRAAWTGEPFEYDGRRALVRPRPVQPAGPPLILGGSTRRAARRAAEIGDGFDPTDPELIADYLEACTDARRTPGEARPRVGPFFVHVSEDPERDRARLAPHVHHEMTQYARWAAIGSPVGGAPDLPIEAVWTDGSHVVLTPEECVELLRGLDPTGVFALHPLAGGTPPAMAEQSLSLFVDRVLPALT
ncbi:LLM class flavin-dependent oxidoreductase [Streptomyces flaveolus]|uniref:LLM class flavin-dependent oxidoreductase n=1 Tax=Streptomyces flaveolus TaxID=67297 RepID=UPI0037F8ADF5